MRTNLAHFHRWERWRALLRAVPFAVVDRPEYELSSLAAPAAVAFASARVAENHRGYTQGFGHWGRNLLQGYGHFDEFVGWLTLAIGAIAGR